MSISGWEWGRKSENGGVGAAAAPRGGGEGPPAGPAGAQSHVHAGGGRTAGRTTEDADHRAGEPQGRCRAEVGTVAEVDHEHRLVVERGQRLGAAALGRAQHRRSGRTLHRPGARPADGHRPQRTLGPVHLPSPTGGNGGGPGAALAALTGWPWGPPVDPPPSVLAVLDGLGADVARWSAAVGTPVHVDGGRLLTERARLLGLERRGRVSANGSCRLLRTADGWLALNLSPPDDLAAVDALVGGPAGDDPWAAVAAAASAVPGAELVDRARLLGMPAAELGVPGGARPAVVAQRRGAPGPGPPAAARVAGGGLSAPGARPRAAYLPAPGRATAAAGAFRPSRVGTGSRPAENTSASLSTSEPSAGPPTRTDPGPDPAGAGTGLALLFAVMLGVPPFVAVSGSLMGDYGNSFSLTLVNYRALFAQSGLIGPLERSLLYGAITATVTIVLGFICARLLSGHRRTKATGALDFLLVASVALPGVVFGAGYIFAYNLPFLSTLGINLYQTTSLLIIAYVASSLPTNARVLVGAVSQVQPSLHDAARAHGAGALRAWGRGVLPAVPRPLVMAWLFTFCGIFLELPISQLLYAPGSPPLSVSINLNLTAYHFGIGMAQAVIAVGIALGVVSLALLAYRLLAPAGWRRIGATIHG